MKCNLIDYLLIKISFLKIFNHFKKKKLQERRSITFKHATSGNVSFININLWSHVYFLIIQMATEAEATREARAKVIAAEGEQKASLALKGAADIINSSPVALQLRYLQTLTNISAEKNSTIIFPVPIEMLRTFSNR